MSKNESPYLAEINKGDKYKIGDTIYTVEIIKITNVISKYDFVTGIFFKSENHSFGVNADQVIENKIYERIYENE